MKPTIKPKRTAEQRADEEAVRRQHAANPIRERPAGAIQQQSFAAILGLLARFKSARESQGLTLAQVADRMGIDPPALSRLETGKVLNPTLATLHKWAEALGRKLDVDLSPRCNHWGTQMGVLSRRIERLLSDLQDGKIILPADQTSEGIAELKQDLEKIRRLPSGEVDLKTCTPLVRHLSRTILSAKKSLEQGEKPPVEHSLPDDVTPRKVVAVQREYFQILSQFVTVHHFLKRAQLFRGSPAMLEPHATGMSRMS